MPQRASDARAAFASLAQLLRVGAVLRAKTHGQRLGTDAAKSSSSHER